MGWSEKYKKSINCDNPKGFSQRAHCQGRKKKMNEAKEKGDHEVSMAQSQLKKSEENIRKLRKVLGKKEKNIPAWVQAKITDTEHNTDAASSYMDEANKSGDEGLHDWFNKSKSKGGKKGWVQLGGKYAGKPCARQPGQTSTPKCGSSKMAANLSAEEEERARERKNRQDPNQPEKTGAAKPTNVRTEEVNLQEVKDKPGKGSGKKDACYHKVKSRYKVWPSAYASGALVKCRKKGATNWGTKSEGFSNWRDDFKALEFETIDIIKPEPIKGIRIDELKCWKGYRRKRGSVPGEKGSCVKEKYSNWREELSEDWQAVNKKDKTDGMSPAAVKAYRRENPGSKLKTAVTGDPKPGSKDAKRRKSFCSRSKGQQDMHNIDCSKDPDKAICKARRRWKC